MITRRGFLQGLAALSVMAGPIAKLGALAPEAEPFDFKIEDGSLTHVTISHGDQVVTVSGLDPGTMYTFTPYLRDGILEVGEVVTVGGRGQLSGQYTITRTRGPWAACEVRIEDARAD